MQHCGKSFARTHHLKRHLISVHKQKDVMVSEVHIKNPMEGTSVFKKEGNIPEEGERRKPKPKQPQQLQPLQ